MLLFFKAAWACFRFYASHVRRMSAWRTASTTNPLPDRFRLFHDRILVLFSSAPGSYLLLKDWRHVIVDTGKMNVWLIFPTGFGILVRYSRSFSQKHHKGHRAFGTKYKKKRALIFVIRWVNAFRKELKLVSAAQCWLVSYVMTYDLSILWSPCIKIHFKMFNL